MRRLCLGTLAILFCLNPPSVQAVVTLEYLVLMTVVDGENTQSIQFPIERFHLRGHSTRSGAVAGTVLEDIEIEKEVDKASPLLFSLTCSDAEIEGATIQMTIRDDRTPNEESEYILNFKEPLLSSHQYGGTSGSVLDEGSVPIESLTLNFEKFDALFLRKSIAGEVLEEVRFSKD